MIPNILQKIIIIIRNNNQINSKYIKMNFKKLIRNKFNNNKLDQKAVFNQ